MRLLIPALLAGALLMQTSCGEKKQSTSDSESTTPPAPSVAVPEFNADSAYNHIATQVGFGPRVPGSKAQKACADWMEQALKQYCDTVIRQATTVKGGDGKQLPCYNLIGSLNPAASQRVLLLAHWDSRPWADMDTENKDQPIDAADDGGSGVGVLLEVARQLKAHRLPAGLGVDILFVDVEDYGRSEWGEASYCLGTQYWARNPHVPGYRAYAGVLLDMVGARGARFPMEQSSTQYARDVQQGLWQAASQAGFSSYFPFEPSQGVITDDHVFVNELARIPTVDVIHLSNATNTGFAPHWHTHADSLPIIDKSTLKAVGQALLYWLLHQPGAAAQAGT